MIRTKWICPTCKELSPTRHWSVERHIKRKHAGIGEPISINTYQTRIQMNIQSGWSNIHASTNMMNFTHETNKSQRDGSSYRCHKIILKAIIMLILVHIKKYIQKKILFFLLLQVIMTMKRQEEDFYLNLLRIEV
jgi:hypothetical protein